MGKGRMYKQRGGKIDAKCPDTFLLGSGSSLAQWHLALIRSSYYPLVFSVKKPPRLQAALLFDECYEYLHSAAKNSTSGKELLDPTNCLEDLSKPNVLI